MSATCVHEQPPRGTVSVRKPKVVHADRIHADRPGEVCRRRHAQGTPHMYGCRFAGRREGKGEHFARLNLRLPAGLLEQATAAAGSGGTTVSEVVRRLLAQWLEPGGAA